MSAQSSVLFYAQIQSVDDRFKNTSSGLAVTAPSLAIAWSKEISFEAIALDKASRKVTAVCRTPYPLAGNGSTKFGLILTIMMPSHHWRRIETRARTCACLVAEA
jgi:hypothetical protein